MKFSLRIFCSVFIGLAGLCCALICPHARAEYAETYPAFQENLKLEKCAKDPALNPDVLKTIYSKQAGCAFEKSSMMEVEANATKKNSLAALQNEPEYIKLKGKLARCSKIRDAVEAKTIDTNQICSCIASELEKKKIGPDNFATQAGILTADFDKKDAIETCLSRL